MFKKLTHLIFSESSYQNIVVLPFVYPPINFCSSTLLVLNVKIDSFDTCLCFLDGRFNQLHTLILESDDIWPSGKIENQVRVFTKKRKLNLLYFSFVGRCTKSKVFFLVLFWTNRLLRSINSPISLSIVKFRNT